MTHEPGSPHASLRENADQAWQLYCTLGRMVPYRESTSGGQGEIVRQKRTVAPIPWNTAAAELTIEFHNEIRRLEVHLKERVIGGYPRRRGSSNANTKYAIESVVNLCETTDNETLHGVLGYLTGWNRRTDRILHPERGLHRLPRQPGENEARCPYCHAPTLRWSPAQGIAVCVRPACRNTNGQRPRWTADFTPTSNGPVFHWTEQEAA
jgi:hypothetical protein